MGFLEFRNIAGDVMGVCCSVVDSGVICVVVVGILVVGMCIVVEDVFIIFAVVGVVVNVAAGVFVGEVGCVVSDIASVVVGATVVGRVVVVDGVAAVDAVDLSDVRDFESLDAPGVKSTVVDIIVDAPFEDVNTLDVGRVSGLMLPRMRPLSEVTLSKSGLALKGPDLGWNWFLILTLGSFMRCTFESEFGFTGWALNTSLLCLLREECFLTRIYLTRTLQSLCLFLALRILRLCISLVELSDSSISLIFANDFSFKTSIRCFAD